MNILVKDYKNFNSVTFDFKMVFSNFVTQLNYISMGKGDKKSKRGKINNGSYGKRRPRKSSKTIAASEEKSKA